MRSKIAPHCRNCGKPLKKSTWLYEVPEGQEPPNVGDTIILHKKERKVHGITRKPSHPFGNSGRLWMRVWLGCWGGYGDNRFCGLTCAHSWACEHCPYDKQ